MSESAASPPLEVFDATSGERISRSTVKRTITLSGLTKIEIQSPTLGRLEFRPVTVGSLSGLEKRLKGDGGSDRDLVAEILQLHLVTSGCNLGTLAELPDPELFAIAADWGSRPGTLGAELSVADMPNGFANALRALPERTLQGIREAMKPLVSSSLARPSLPPGFADLMRPSPIMEAMQRQIAQQNALEKSLGLHSWAIRDEIALKGLIPPTFISSGVVESINLAMKRVQVENELLRGLVNPWPLLQESIVDAMRLRDRASEAASLAGIRSADRMVRRLNSVATSVEHVWTHWADLSRNDFDGWSEPQIEGPSVNLLNASLVTDTLLAEEGAEATLEGLSHDPLALDALISEWHPGLLEPLNGSRHALRSRGPDYVRQHGASLRELMRAALHALAPDEEVLSWAQPNGLIDNKGRPTRRARVTFICTRGTPTAYADLVTRVVDHYLSVVDFLDQGVHRIRTSTPGNQHAKLQLAQRHAEDLLRQLIALKLLRG